MCWRNFCNFPWWLENVESRSKIALFSNECHFEIWFPKKKTITFFWSKLSTQKRPNFACDNYILPKTRGNKNKQLPIPHSLKMTKINKLKKKNHPIRVFFFFLHEFCYGTLPSSAWFCRDASNILKSVFSKIKIYMKSANAIPSVQTKIMQSDWSCLHYIYKQSSLYINSNFQFKLRIPTPSRQLGLI